MCIVVGSEVEVFGVSEYTGCVVTYCLYSTKIVRETKLYWVDDAERRWRKSDRCAPGLGQRRKIFLKRTR